MEKMNLSLDNAVLQSSDPDLSIHHDSDTQTLSDTQFKRVSHGTPQKSVTTPHSSTVLSTESTVTSQVDQFASESLQACSSKFCDNAEPWEDTTGNMAPVSPSNSHINLRLLESSPKESACSTFYDHAKPNEDTSKGLATVSPDKFFSHFRLLFVEFNPRESACTTFCGSLKAHKNSAEDMRTVSPSSFYRIPSLLQCDPKEWDDENSFPKCEFRERKRSFPTRLGSSPSDIGLNTSGSDMDSILAHRESDISDLSMTESENLNSDEDIAIPPKLEEHDKIDEEFPIDCYSISSPKKPMSPVGEFLNWRRNKFGKKVSSVNNICTPETKKRKDGDSIFLMTV